MRQNIINQLQSIPFGGAAMFGGLISGTLSTLPLYLFWAGTNPTKQLLCLLIELMIIAMVRKELLKQTEKISSSK